MRSRLEPLLLVALGLLGFFCTAALLRPHVQADHETETADKLEFVAAHPQRFNALIAGASGVFRGIDPRVFDARVQVVEPSFASFNLGARGLLAYETDALVRRAVLAVEHGGGRIEWVVLEPKNWDAALSAADVKRTRTRAWHDARQTANAFQVAAAELLHGEPFALAWAGRHLQGFAQRSANYGAARGILRPLLGETRRPYVSPEILSQAAGYRSIEASEPARAYQRNLDFRSKLDAYAEELAAFAAEPPEPLLAPEIAAHRRQREWLEARGIRVLYLMPPYGTHGRAGATLHAAGEAPLFHDFARPDDYPQLYVPEARLDQEHLTEAAAQVFSQLAGEALAELLRSSPTLGSEHSEGEPSGR